MSTKAPPAGTEPAALPAHRLPAEQTIDGQPADPPPRPANPQPGPGSAAAGSDPDRRQGAPERVVSFRPRAVLVVLGVLAAAAAAVGFVFVAHSGFVLIAIAVFFGIALNPVVEFFCRRGLKRHWAVAAVCVLAVAALALLMVVFIPPLVRQATDFAHAAPGFVSKLSRGTGPAGFLERKYHVVQRLHTATSGHGSTSLTGAALSGLSVLKGLISSVVGAIIVGFLTLFMLLEGPAWRARLTGLLPERNRTSAERIGSGIYQAVGGFVAGNLLASLAAGVVATVLLLLTGVPYALPLGLFVVIIELVPYIGPVVVTVLLSLVALTQGLVPGLVVFGVLLAYHIIEGHTLRPLIYGRALKLSALAVLIAIVLGTEIAGILGALAAIPVAGAIQVIATELLRQRSERTAQDAIS